VIGLDHLTGLTEGANGAPLSGIALQANGSLVLYEPNASGIGIWQTYSASGKLLLSGTYQDSSWGLGASVSSPIAVNLVEAGQSIDYFAANGAPVSGLSDTGSGQTALSGIGILVNGAHDAGSLNPLQLPDLSSPWFGGAQWSPGGVIPDDVLSLLNQNLQFNASLASSSDTVFVRSYDHYLALTGGSDPAFVDYNDAGDWSYGGRTILTLGRENVVLSKSAPAFIANAQDATDNLNPMQGYQPASDLIAGIANESGQTIAIFSGYGEGGRGHDFLYGVASDDILIGGGGNDYLYGSAGNDWLEGGSGADRLMGAAGDDQLIGGSGRDWFNGGSGVDIFVFRSPSDSRPAAPDIIEDFVHGIDKIDLSTIDANTKRAGDQAFVFAGSSTTLTANGVSWFESGGNTVVRVDVDANKTADLQLTLLGTNLGLSAADFVL
jgi:Ca2+-binding RTX toxin-like protein